MKKTMMLIAAVAALTTGAADVKTNVKGQAPAPAAKAEVKDNGEPKELTAARAAYQKKLEVVRKEYLGILEKLRGDLEKKKLGVEVVMEEIKGLKEEMGDVEGKGLEMLERIDIKSEILGEWQTSGGAFFNIEPKGKIAFYDQNKTKYITGKWKTNKKQVIATLDNGETCVFTFDDSNKLTMLMNNKINYTMKLVEKIKSNHQ